MNDARLARRAAAGDRRAFEAIFRRYHQDLYRFCLSTVGNPQDAQDALQNTMVKALRALPGEQREIELKPWLYRIARNESVEMLRRRREGAELDPEQPASTPEIPATVAARERLRLLLVDLEALPERQRSTLTMRELAGLDFDEIGAALGTSAAVARQTLYEARLGLRQMEAGREMDCDPVMRALSDADGRVTRRRDIRAHLRGCAECRAFRDGMARRRDEFTAISPLPVAASAALLHSLLGGQAGASIAAGAGTASVATSAVVKSVATVAVVAAVGVGAADRSGVIDLPPNGGNEKGKSAADPAGSSSPSGQAGPEGAAKPASRGNGGREASGPQSRMTGPADRKPATKHAEGGTANGGKPSKPSHPVDAKPAAGTPRGNSGHGKPQAARRGPPEGLPPASNRGQQTAATRKPPQANPSPGRTNESSGKAAAPKPPPSSKSEGAAPSPPPAAAPEPVEPSSPGKSGSAPKGTDIPAESATP